MIETYLYNALTASANITALTSTRIYPLEVPEEPTLPAISYRIIAAVSAPTMETSGMTKYRVQCDCWATSYPQAVSLRDAVIATLDGYQDQYFSSFSTSMSDEFEHELLQYVCIADFYILSTN